MRHDQTKEHPSTCHRRLSRGWLTLFLSSLLLVGFTFITVPLAAAFGATRAAQRLARPVIALVGAVTVGSFVGSAVALGPLGIVLMASVAAVLYLMLGNLDDARKGVRAETV